MALFFKRLFQRPSRISSPSSFTPRPAPTGQPVPRRPRPVSRHPAYVLVVDESGSTSSPFRMADRRTISRMQAIQWAAQGYLQQLLAANPRQAVAVVGFSDTARLCHRLAPVGAANGRLSCAVRSLQPRGLTNLSAGLALALDQLSTAGVSRGNLVVITDGGANKGTSSLSGLLDRAKRSRVRIFTIGVGNNGNGDYDRDLLVKMARSTGGRFASAHSFGTLCQALARAV